MRLQRSANESDGVQVGSSPSRVTATLSTRGDSARR
jgi:hypothetical protein